jgi:hypothetical protein
MKIVVEKVDDGIGYTDDRIWTHVSHEYAVSCNSEVRIFWVF